MSASIRMPLFVRIVVCTTLLVSGASADMIIDEFAIAQSLAVSSTSPTDSSTVMDSGTGTIIGGQRQVNLEYLSGPGIANVEIHATGSNDMAFSIQSNTDALATLIWDAGSSLGGLDLTEGGMLLGLGVMINSDDLEADLNFQIRDTANNVATAQLALPGDLFSPQEMFLSFSAFSGVDMTSVDAISLTIDAMFPAVDLEIDYIKATTPEPAGLALLAFGGLSVIRRKR